MIPSGLPIPQGKRLRDIHKFIKYYLTGETFCVLKEKEERLYGGIPR